MFYRMDPHIYNKTNTKIPRGGVQYNDERENTAPTFSFNTVFIDKHGCFDSHAVPHRLEQSLLHLYAPLTVSLVLGLSPRL